MVIVFGKRMTLGAVPDKAAGLRLPWPSGSRRPSLVSHCSVWLSLRAVKYPCALDFGLELGYSTLRGQSKYETVRLLLGRKTKMAVDSWHILFV